jgi:hypothetical protein
VSIICLLWSCQKLTTSYNNFKYRYNYLHLICFDAFVKITLHYYQFVIHEISAITNSKSEKKLKPLCIKIDASTNVVTCIYMCILLVLFWAQHIHRIKKKFTCWFNSVIYFIYLLIYLFIYLFIYLSTFIAHYPSEQPMFCCEWLWCSWRSSYKIMLIVSCIFIL